MSQFLPETRSLQCIEVLGREPVSLEEAKLFLRVDSDAEDALISSLIQSARANAEGMTHRVLRKSRWEWVVGDFTQGGELPVTPCIECSSILSGESVVEKTLYTFIPGGNISPLFGRIEVRPGFPTGEVHLVLLAGYEDGLVPCDIHKWILTRVADFYEQRESYATGTMFHEFSRTFVDALLDPYRIVDV